MGVRLSLLAAALFVVGCQSSSDADASYDDGVSEAGAIADPMPSSDDGVSQAGPIDEPMAEAAPGTVQPMSTVRFDYAGTLADGTQFDSGSNVTFNLMDMVPGFRNGMVGMAPGETKTFDVQPADGYGNNPPPGIPVGAVMTFEVTVHEVM